MSYNAHQDSNQIFSVIGVAGTLGTADTLGTARTVPFSGNPLTGAQYVEPLGTLSTAEVPLGGVVKTTSVAVGTTATALPGTALANRKSCFFYNAGTATVYYGGSGVTSTSGIPVVVGDSSRSIDLGTTVLYGIATTVGGTVNVLEVS